MTNTTHTTEEEEGWSWWVSLWQLSLTNQQYPCFVGVPLVLCGEDYKIYSHNGDHIYFVYYNEKAGGICVSCPSAADGIAAVFYPSIHFLNCLSNLGSQGVAAYSGCPRVKGGIYLSRPPAEWDRQPLTLTFTHTVFRHTVEWPQACMLTKHPCFCTADG